MSSPTLMALLVVALAAHFAGASIVGDMFASTQPATQARMGRKLLDISSQTMSAADALQLRAQAFKAQGARLAAKMQKQQAESAPKEEIEATLKEWMAWVAQSQTIQADAQKVTKSAANDDGVEVSADIVSSAEDSPSPSPSPPADPIAAFFQDIVRQGTALVQSVTAEIGRVTGVVTNWVANPASFVSEVTAYTQAVGAQIAAVGNIVQGIITAPNAADRNQLIQQAVQTFQQAAAYQQATAACNLASAFGNAATSQACKDKETLASEGAVTNPFLPPTVPGGYSG